MIWVASLGSALTIALVTAFGSGAGQRLFATTFGSRPSGSPEESDNKPLRVESAGYLPGFNEVFAFRSRLSGKQVIAATRGIQQGAYAMNMSRVIAMGGAPAYLQDIQIVIHDSGTQVATVTGIRVVKSCAAPFRGTELYNPAQSAINDESMGFDLGSPITSAQFVNMDDSFHGNYFSERVIQLRPGESDAISAFVLASRVSCRFTFALSYDYGSGGQVVSIDNGRRPFVITAGLPFVDFSEIYAGGDAIPHPGGPYVRANPEDFQGYIK